MNKAFQNCSSLEYAVFPNVYISGNTNGQYIFNNCSSLKRLGWYGYTRYTPAYTFAGCSQLTRVDIESLENWLRQSWGVYNATYRSGPFDVSQNGHLYINDIEQKDIVIPNTVAELPEGCFRYIVGITSVNIPSSVTSIASHAFMGCSGLENLVIPSSVASVDIGSFHEAGNAIGKLTIGGNLNRQSAGNYGSIRFRKIIVNGDITNSGQQVCINSSRNIEEMRVLGNLNSGSSVLYGGSGETNCMMKFFELMGKVISGRFFYDNSYSISPAGAIVHLGYNTVSNGELPCTPTNAGADLARVNKIYVGTGESQAGDQTILDMYLADSAWSTYASKLDLWWNYNGEYKNS